MTRMEKYSRLRSMIEYENDKHNREVALLAFSSMFKESNVAYQNMLASSEVINEKAKHHKNGHAHI